MPEARPGLVRAAYGRTGPRKQYHCAALERAVAQFAEATAENHLIATA